MPAYTVIAVADQVREWKTSKGAPWKSYRVTLRNESGAEKGNVELSRPAGDPAPTVNEVVEGTVENREQYGPKLNVPRRGGGGGGWNKAKPVEERRSIAMQHAQKCSVEYLKAAGAEVVTVDRVVETAWVLFRQVMAAETTDRPVA